jgi:alpha-tubulin suppressor-like RCC1 family protein
MSDSGIITVALGQDHTLSLSKSGSVLSWGLNLFLQLRYALDGDISQTDRNESQVP